jgi:hypothetical protein
MIGVIIAGKNGEEVQAEAEIVKKVELLFIAPLLDTIEEKEEEILYLVEEFHEYGTVFNLFEELQKPESKFLKRFDLFFMNK